MNVLKQTPRNDRTVPGIWGIICCLHNFSSYQARKQLIDSESLLVVAKEAECIGTWSMYVISQFCAQDYFSHGYRVTVQLISTLVLLALLTFHFQHLSNYRNHPKPNNGRVLLLTYACTLNSREPLCGGLHS